MKTCISITLFLTLFTASVHAQTSWTKDASNPVLRRDTVLANLPNDIIAISDGWVAKEGNTYKMWYTCGGLNYPTDTLLRSRICYATSADGLNWTKYAGNPVMDVSYSGAWDSLGVETATVIIDSVAPAGERYKMWYAGQYFNAYRYDIGYATSPDGMNWTKQNTPVLSVGTAAEWDNGFLEGPSVIKAGNQYQMWYCGYDATVNGSTTDGQANIGLATSGDGINWTKYAGNPVLSVTPGNWDAVYVQDPHVLYENGQYLMWFGGNNVDGYGQKVGYATSPDGINWTKFAGNPVLNTGNSGEWDASTASFPSVLNDNGTYKMWYTGKDVDPLPANSLDYYWEIGYAVSGIATLSETSAEYLRIFPNPAGAKVSVLLPEHAHWTVHLYSTDGALLQTHQISGTEIILRTDYLRNGVYYLQVTNDRAVLSSKIVVQ